ncbi:MAG TPA: type II toxin-antitoxin system VapC family toxin [Candidatus Nanopelagicales bacterium]|nr:type II toxin-antitoxin system VapC family toxin [Candidatus Nanopelagicales bacterium]
MILDTSALIALIEAEPEADTFLDVIAHSSRVSISAATYVEASIVIDSRNNPVLSRSFDTLLDDLAVTIEPVTAEQAVVARQAYRDFGKGRQHPAQLNFGDCFSYALASTEGQPLLYKGQDFSHTDVRSAVGN